MNGERNGEMRLKHKGKVEKRKRRRKPKLREKALQVKFDILR